MHASTTPANFTTVLTVQAVQLQQSCVLSCVLRVWHGPHRCCAHLLLQMAMRYGLPWALGPTNRTRYLCYCSRWILPSIDLNSCVNVPHGVPSGMQICCISCSCTCVFGCDFTCAYVTSFSHLRLLSNIIKCIWDMIAVTLLTSVQALIPDSVILH